MLSGGKQGDQLKAPILKVGYFERLPEPTPKGLGYFSGSEEGLTTGNFGRRIHAISQEIYSTLESKEFRHESWRVPANIPRDGLSYMALGWLAQEGRLKKEMLGDYMHPKSERPNPEEMELTKTKIEDLFVTDWTMGDDVSKVQNAMRKAFAFGMHRRKETLGMITYGEDWLIGERAGEILKSIAKNVSTPKFTDVVNEVCEMDERAHSRIPHHEEVFLVAAAVGWLASDNALILKGGKPYERFALEKPGELTIELNLGVPVEGNRVPEIERHAGEILGQLKGGSRDITALMKAFDHQLLTAMSIGWLLHKNEIEFKASSDKVVINRKVKG